MKKLLLATVATIALTASGALAAEQGAKDHAGGTGAEMRGHAPAKAGTTGSGINTESGAGLKAGAEVKPDAHAKDGAKMKGSASTRSKTETTGAGAAEPKSGADTHSGAQMKSETKSGDKTQMKSETRTGNKTQTTGSAPSGGAVNLTSEQKTTIRTTVIAKAPKVEQSKINFSINIGTVVPRTVHLVAVPTTLVEIHPAWRGYRYFVVGDEIVIVEPSTLKIVYVLTV